MKFVLRAMSTWVNVLERIVVDVAVAVQALRIGGIGYNGVRLDPPVKIRIVVCHRDEPDRGPAHAESLLETHAH